jgi:hypothetical protein
MSRLGNAARLLLFDATMAFTRYPPRLVEAVASPFIRLFAWSAINVAMVTAGHTMESRNEREQTPERHANP